MFDFTVIRLRVALAAVLMAAAVGVACAQVKVNGTTASLIYDGIDVSSYQKDIDWSATAQDKNIKFVYVKATEGATYRSRHYQINIDNARQHGILVGAYHFFRPNISVERQFLNFTSIVKKEEQDLIPLIDIEVRGNIPVQALVDSVLLFAEKLERHYGCRPMIYTGSAFYNSYLSGRVNGYPLFIARYSKVEPRLVGGAKWVLWQFSEKGVIAGIDHAVDLCRFNKGCGLNDIRIKGNKSSRSSRQQATVPPRQKKEVAEPRQVPPRKETAKQRKEREKAEKEAQKMAEKRRAEEAKEAERLAKQKEKLRKLREKEEKEAAKQAQKRQEKAKKEALKQKEKEEKRHQEQVRRQQKEREDSLKKKEKERQEQAKRRQANARPQQSAAKPRQAQNGATPVKQQTKPVGNKTRGAAEPAKKPATKAPAKKQSQNQKATSKGRRVNQSSADNDDIYY